MYTDIIPVLLSPESFRSELVFVYENPTPAGDSRNRIFATVSVKHVTSISFCLFCFLKLQFEVNSCYLYSMNICSDIERNPFC